MSHPSPTPGHFCWYDLATSDAAGAKSFYGGLFGWTTTDDETPVGVYSHIRNGEIPLGGMYSLSDEMKQAGVPPHWMPYVTVEDAAASLERAAGLGGKVVMGPYPAGDAGILGVLTDPTGAAVALWQPKTPKGERVPNADHGAVCWNELMTGDTAAARQFYGEFFGWQANEMPMPTGMYTMFTLGEARIGGMMAITKEMGEVPPHWMSYVSVADCDATAAKAKELGGGVLVPPMDVPQVGRFCMIRDPQGAALSVIKLAAMPE
ncbi:hypothetical protein ABI59_07375 [Acidobacteria bacterium Mor1]|nr:hypothetical protein ABI59_07375 [Acidobacteria bacterium Mor1]